MSNFLSSGAGWLAKQLNKHASLEVTYSRGAVTISIDSSKGRSTFESSMSDGTVANLEPVDWIVSGESLCRLQSRLGDPMDGDRISDGKNNYEVLSPGNEKPFRYADQYESVLRIHTKEVY